MYFLIFILSLFLVKCAFFHLANRFIFLCERCIFYFGIIFFVPRDTRISNFGCLVLIIFYEIKYIVHCKNNKNFILVSFQILISVDETRLFQSMLLALFSCGMTFLIVAKRLNNIHC